MRVMAKDALRERSVDGERIAAPCCLRQELRSLAIGACRRHFPKDAFMVTQELLSFLLVLAAKLSGYPAIPLEDLPPIEVMSEQALADAVCPETGNGCTNIVATFETGRYVIYVRDTLDLENAADNSFLLHELVHVLRSDPLIANTSVEYAQVPDRRAGSRSMDRSHKTGAPLVARKPARNPRIAEPAKPVK
jgi:hypothetical protein